MTDYEKVKGTQTEKPQEIDVDSSKDTVYERKDITWVDTNPGDDDNFQPHWEYMERTYTKDEWIALNLKTSVENINALMMGLTDLYELQLENGAM